MAQAPDEIRDEIEATRARMSDTVEAIGYRADIKQRTKGAIVDKAKGAVEKVTGAMPDVGAAASKVGDAGSSAASAVGDTMPSREQMRHAASVAQSNPLGLMIGATAVGFLVGLALPSTRIEDEKIGELADDLKQQVREVGQETARRGGDVIKETAQAATSAAQEAGQQHADELAETVQQRAQDLTS